MVSVIIPCFNLGDYLREAVESVHDDRDANVEIIIVDDGSTDQTTQEELNLLEQEGYSVIHQENKGVAAARNQGISQAQGEYILTLDADNQIEPAYYQKAAEILDQMPEVGVVYSDKILFGDKHEHVQVDDFRPGPFLNDNYIDNCAVFRKKAWEEVGGFDPEPKLTGNEDWEFWINLFKNGYKFYHIEEYLFYYRVRPNSLLKRTLDPGNRHEIFQYITSKHKSLYKQYIDDISYPYHEGVLVTIFRSIYLEREIEKAKETVDLKESHLNEYKNHWQQTKEALDKTRADLEATKTKLSQAEARVDELLQERNKLQETYEKLLDEKESLQYQINNALTSIQKLQERVNAFEQSKYFKLIRYWNHFKNRFRSQSLKSKRWKFLNKILFFFKRKTLSAFRKFMALVFKHLYILFEEQKVVIVTGSESHHGGVMTPYMQWREKNRILEDDIIRFKKEARHFTHQPLFSIIIPVYNPDDRHFREALESVIHQIYENWELCLADDCSSNPQTHKTLQEYEKNDPRIRVTYRQVNGHISAASNTALEMAEGDYVVLMDQDDLLTQDALFRTARLINDHPEADLIYTDEDKIDEFGIHSDPHFKPDWCPDNLLSRNYLGHLTIFRTTLFKWMGGWREGFEGSQDYDLVLRFTELTNNIFHIPNVLYHWRIHAESAASDETAKPYAYTSAMKALTEALTRREEPGQVSFLNGFRGYGIRYELKEENPKVSIIIPSKDKADILSTCLYSIIEKSTYTNIEIVLVDNNSSEKDFFTLVDTFQQQEPQRFRYVRSEIPFNFSKLVNTGVANSTGDYIILLNNDIEVLTEDWIEGMLEQVQRPSIGAAGAKLLYPNDTIQHAGVIIGLGGVAGHVLVGEDRFGPGYFNYVNLINNFSAITAACLMTKRDTWQLVGGFDEAFSVEYNDVDFCLRVREKGLDNIYLPHVELYHYESLSRGHSHLDKKSFEKHKQESSLFQSRWENYIDHDPCYNPNLSLGNHDFRIRI